MQMNQKTQKRLDKLRKTFSRDLGESGLCDLGSCQYKPVQATFEFALAYLRLDRAAFEEEFGITYKKQLTEEEFIAALQKDMDDYWAERKKEDEAHDDLEEDDYYEVPRFESIEDYFEFLKDRAWDLWSAAQFPFIGLDMAPHKLQGFAKTGFLINDMITEDSSFTTGIQIAYITLLYNTPIDAYAEFST